ncbi:carboxypeptidase Y-deficient [Podospora pseudopauciseta]|uniref:Carboxypeptidase Y-deficient n=1 Tax=Podospora pseudopauciseta TaxID=2093780 RepID=A0ABR0HEF9_9PEZI|nr:carboxypeptidase Y-deficient [Podospora pseudopauciseta]
MSAPRRLGGGRILGSGSKGLAPPSSSSSTPAPGGANPRRASANTARAVSPFPPSESSVSVGSYHSRLSSPNSLSPPLSSTLPPFAQDLVSHVSLAGPSNRASSSGGLVCPICNEEMVTLLQLNRHLDDVHQELPEAEQDEVKSWFDKQVLKAKRFQPLSLINQKLRGMDVFESNESQPVSAPAAPGRIAETVVDPEELVTRKHWQRSSGNDTCTDPTCDRKLGPLNGSVNCRKCGRLFCEEHTMYQMKLSRSANHEPVRGIWCRVCETCYKSRGGYNDHNGISRDHTADFAAVRARKVERQRLEVQRLEKRLTKLTRLLAEGPQDAGVNSALLSPLGGAKHIRKTIEQSVVAWEEDASVARCPFCKQEFRSWTFRRHHCRICGRVVCADPATGCSSEIGFNVATPTALPAAEKPTGGGHISVDVRMCCDCKTTIFSHRDFTDSITHKPPDQIAYENLRQFELGIRNMMPKFHKALVALQPPDDNSNKPPPTHAEIQHAASIRKRLTYSFRQYGEAAKRIQNMPTDSPTQRVLQQKIYAAASAFMHTNMLPLKSLPSILKASGPGHRRLLSNGPSHSPLRNGESATFDAETSSVGGASEVSTAVSALETEEKEAKEKLIVLEEQRFMVHEMLNHARAARRFEEVTALTKNIEELDREIEGSKRTVADVAEKFQGLYVGGA